MIERNGVLGLESPIAQISFLSLDALHHLGNGERRFWQIVIVSEHTARHSMAEHAGVATLSQLKPREIELHHLHAHLLLLKPREGFERATHRMQGLESILSLGLAERSNAVRLCQTTALVRANVIQMQRPEALTLL